MAKLVIKFYLERSLSLRYLLSPQREASREGPVEAVMDDNFETAAVTKDKCWETGTRFYVSFLDGDPRVHKRIESFAKQWCQYANIDFIFRPHPSPHIRISFKDSFSWSYIGRECAKIPLHKPTMNF